MASAKRSARSETSAPPSKRIANGDERTPSLHPVFASETYREDVAEAFRVGMTAEAGEGQLVVGDHPFPHATIQSLTEDASFIDRLQQEILGLEYMEKANDLYRFKQTTELAGCTLPNVSALHRLLFNDLRPWMEAVCGEPLHDKGSLFAAQYNMGDTLLCHDDKLEGRRIAFILYLVPEDWCEEDGGHLELYGVNAKGRPGSIKKRICPMRGGMAFFPVMPVSFHRVGEVFSENKTRLSISGWFYAAKDLEIGSKEADEIDALSRPTISDLPREAVLQRWMEWINEDYLEAENIVQLGKTMEMQSAVHLQRFLREDKYKEICREMIDAKEGTWRRCGPADESAYAAAVVFDAERYQGTCGPTTKTLLDLLCSEDFARYLNQITEMMFVDVRGVVRQFSPGDYTLMHDGVRDVGFPTLDLVLHVGAAFLEEHHGGQMVYVADKEDLITCEPKPNTLSLVYREAGVMRFVRYLSKRAPEPLFDIFMTFREDPSAEEASSEDDGDEGEDDADNVAEDDDDDEDVGAAAATTGAV